MSSNTTIEKARSQALQKIGRNLVEFQKAEAIARYILASQKLSGTAKQLNQNWQRQSAAAARLPLGHLIDRAMTALHSESEATKATQESLTEPWICYSLNLTGGKDAARAWEKLSAPIVRERNKLVHKMLGSLDLSSVESLESLSAALDEQLASVTPSLKTLGNLFTNVRDLQLDAFQKAMDSLPSGKSPG